jgi:ribosome-binding ATPase YchF (GTP1/OBG family)
MVDVPRAAYPFTTIKPNVGVSYATAKCICEELKVSCKPKNSKCENGLRLIPVTAIDVAGLVPDSHLGKGMGNQFLSDLTDADGLIHIVDLSGKTDEKGEPTESHDPLKDIEFLEKEIDYWIHGILEKNWSSIERKQKMGTELYKLVYEPVSGLKISEEKIKEIIKKGYDNLFDLAHKIRVENKPIILAGNKIDLLSSQENFERLKDKHNLYHVCAEAELALRKADREGLIKYVPGTSKFESLKQLPEQQENALNFIQENVLDKYGSTGVQNIINELIFNKLDYIPVYPVEDESKFADKNGNPLPDVYLLKKGSTALDLAFKVHTDIGNKFIGGIDARTRKKIGKDHVLKENDVIKILT